MWDKVFKFKNETSSSLNFLFWPYTWYVYWNAGFKLQAVHKVHVVEPVVRDVPDVRGLRDVRVSVLLDSLKIDQGVMIEW